MVDIVNQVSEEVQLKNLDDNRKAALLAEMRRTVRSKLDRVKTRIERAARKAARETSAGNAFRGMREKILNLQNDRKDRVEALGEQFKKEDKVFTKEQRKLSKENTKATRKLEKEFNSAVRKLEKQFTKEHSRVDKKRNKLGESFDRQIGKAQDTYANRIKKVQNQMHDKFDKDMMYVDFSRNAQGSIVVKGVQLSRDPARGLVSDHEELMDAIETWNTFRVGVFSHPDFDTVKKQFDALVKGL